MLSGIVLTFYVLFDKMIEKIVNDERGIRTPEVASTTGLAILRHTGLGYLVPGKQSISQSCI